MRFAVTVGKFALSGRLEKLAVVIASANRATALEETVSCVLRQSRRPAEIVLSVPQGEGHVSASTARLPDVKIIRGEVGLTRQRNRAVDALAAEIELVAFLDDDVELRNDYLSAIARAFCERPDVVFLRGHMVVNGLACNGSERTRARALLADDMRVHAGDQAPLQLDLITSIDAYGATMSVRRAAFDVVRFDERLPLYGYMEDLDFAQQCAHIGKLAYCHNARLVHLFMPSGRIPGIRMGFSQVANPLYLWRKGTLPSRVLCRVLMRHLAANALKSMLPRQPIDRRGRLLGNLMALRSAALGRVAPEEAETLSAEGRSARRLAARARPS